MLQILTSANMWHISIATLCLTITITEIRGQSQVCRFPDILTARSRWETGIVNEHRRTNGYYRFYNTKVEIRDFLSDEEEIVTWHCEHALPNNKFILKMDQVREGGNEEYICMQFFERSEYIIQRKVSKKEGTFNEAICSDNNLTLDDWPLVWPDVDDDYSECPFIGGYAIEIKEYIHDEPLCDEWLKPRLESECIKGEGVKIDFRNSQCKGDLSMDLVQTLLCLGSWQDEKYIFTILTDQDDLWPKLWLMRILKNEENDKSFDAVLSMDIVADQSEFYGNDGLVPLERLYGLVLTTEIYPSLCEDEAEQCEDSTTCDSSNAIYCQKECGVCEKSQVFHECHFTDNTRGEWQEIREDTTKDITVTESILYADDLYPFQCYELYADGWFEGTGRRALATLFKNGCKPRYTCAEFQSRSADVMTYRLGQSLVWPATLNVNAEDVCNDEVFKNDRQPLVAQYRSKDTKILVKKEDNSHDHTYVACNMDMSFGLSGLANDGKRLLGVLWNEVVGHHEGESSDTLLHEVCVNHEVESINPDQAFHSSRILKCLASYKEGNDTQFLLVKEQDNPLNIECWVIHQNDWEYKPRIYVLHPSDCNPDTPNQVEFAHSQHYIAKYEVLEISEELMDPCSKWLKTTLQNRNVSNLPQPPTLETVYTEKPPGRPSLAVIPESDVPDNWSIHIGGMKSASCQALGQIWLVMFGVALIGWLNER